MEMVPGWKATWRWYVIPSMENRAAIRTCCRKMPKSMPDRRETAPSRMFSRRYSFVMALFFMPSRR